jgi:hypothetical protein
MGSEWGLGRLRIGSTTADVSAIHWFAASRLPKARAVSPPGGRLGLTSGDFGSTCRTVQDASRTGEQTAPNPGTSWRGALGEDGRPDERSDSERSEPEHLVSAVDDRE